jgi:hypothetical protein
MSRRRPPNLVDHVIPPVPVRQWVISVPKRLRGFLGSGPEAVAAVTRIFLDEIEKLLCADRLRYGSASAARSRTLGVLENRRFSPVEKRLEDFSHGQIDDLPAIETQTCRLPSTAFSSMESPARG